MFELFGLLTAGLAVTPMAVQLDGVDESITIGALFAGRITGNRTDPFSWGISAQTTTGNAALVGLDAGGAAFDAPAYMQTVGDVGFRSAAKRTSSRIYFDSTTSGTVSSGATFRGAAVWDGAMTEPRVFVDAAQSAGGLAAWYGSNTSTGAEVLSIGIMSGASRFAGYVWAFWWCPVAMSDAQVSALDALIAAGTLASYTAARDYLLALSADSVFIPVLSTDSTDSAAGGSLQDMCGNFNGTPVNTEAVRLVAIP
jgi:hypothetical protein